MNRIESALAAALTMGLAGLLVGCGSTVVPGPPVLPADFTGPGSYTVPAVPDVSFPISEVRIEQEAGGVSLYYDLPADLVGQKTKVELDGTMDASGTLQLSGMAGTSTCSLSTGLLSCKETLSGIQPGPLPGSASNAQRAAAQAFIADPIGVLDVPLPP
jgi:hypothetical protein